VVLDGRTIAGTVLMPFLTRDAEGFDVNKPYDWDLAEYMVKAGTARLPLVPQKPFM
jgi:N-acylneuraminate cytidylyltransferase